MRARLLTTIVGAVFTLRCYAGDQTVSDPGDSGPGTLRAAITAAQSSGGGTITFNIGFKTIVLQSVLPNITANCTIDGADNITISGNDKTPVFYIDPGGTLTLKHLIVTHASNLSDGGAIRNGGTLAIASCKFTNNHAADSVSGGVILNLGALTITNSEFASNAAGNGGVLFPRFSTSSTTASGSSFHDNATTNQTDGWGGVMLVWDGAQVTVDHCTFSKNAALRGGAFYLFAGSGGTKLTATSTLLSGNTAIEGGGVYVASGSTLAMDGSTVDGNTVTGPQGTTGQPCNSTPLVRATEGQGAAVAYTMRAPRC